jgi:hypothetical protein
MESGMYAPSPVRSRANSAAEIEEKAYKCSTNIYCWHSRLHRETGCACQRTDPTLSLYQQVVCSAVGEGAPGTKPRNIDDDEPRIAYCRSPSGSYPSLESEPGAIFVRKTSALSRSASKRLAVSVVLEIQLHRLFATVEPDEVGRHAVHAVVVAARGISTSRLDLDDSSAKFGEMARAERARNGLFNRDDGYTVKGGAHLKFRLPLVAMRGDPLFDIGAPESEELVAQRGVKDRERLAVPIVQRVLRGGER